mgnify:CR=1 FL=1
MKDQGKAVLKMAMLALNMSGENAIRHIGIRLNLSDAQVQRCIETNSFKDEDIDKLCAEFDYTLMFVPNKFLEYCPVF